VFKRIVVGTDGSASAAIALNKACELANATGAELHIVYATKPVSAMGLASPAEFSMAAPMAIAADANDEHAQHVCDGAAEFARDAGLSPEVHHVAGDPADALVRVAEDADADLIIVGNRGMSGARRFVLGSVPNKVSHHCRCSLLIVDTHEPSAS
jgi:nucleotide-binding universal stress UspA family protein